MDRIKSQKRILAVNSMGKAQNTGMELQLTGGIIHMYSPKTLK